jgi:subtilisin family serine protease
MPTYPGMALDPTYAAVPERLAHAHLHRDGEELVEASEHFTVRAHLHLEETQTPPHKAGDADVFVEMRLAPFVKCMVEPAVGTFRDVGERLQLAQLKSLNLTGDKVAIAILDTGIHLPSLTRSLGRAPRFDAQACWNPQHTPREPGTWKVGHGTMCAFDALIAAPDATLVDYPLLEVESPSPDGMMFPYVSSAMRAYGALLASRAHGPLKAYQALVVSNSWGIYHPDDDYPLGHPGRFSDNPTHPFNVQLAAATRAGIDILFAAGNCGRDCPSPNCRSTQGNAIMGCAGLQEVLTVAGCDIHGMRAGFSSQGPSIPGMAPQKPDLMAYTHFLGSALAHDSKPDTGTSAACPVAAGCVAALRSSPKFDPVTVPPAQLFERLRATAERPAGKLAPDWDGDQGWGIISPLNAAT